MCGIIASINNNINKDDESKVLQVLSHRGPNDFGIWKCPVSSVWLGHRRLSIVDLSKNGRQPMNNEDKTIWMVCNGEIYNYPSLRARLEGLGHHFYSHCDNEVILHAYEAWGDACVDYLTGMFAFVLWDKNQQRLLAARDRVGIKPLYYTETRGGIVLSSEAGALLPFFAARPDVEPMSLAYVMTLGYVPSPWSIWQGIYKLEPGNYLTWQKNRGTQKQEYWQPPRHITPNTKNDQQEWQVLFENVLMEHLLTDVPIALFLSGGIDSSSLAVGLQRMEKPVQTITASYSDSLHDEAPIAAAVANRLNFPHTIAHLRTKDVNELIQNVALAFDEPQGYSALLSMYLISKVAARDFKVVLAGDGGDELFGGYTWYDNLNGLSTQSSRWARCLLRLMMRNNDPLGIRGRAVTNFVQQSPLHSHAWHLYPRFLPEEAEALLAPMSIKFGDSEMLAPLKKHFEPTLPLKRALQRVDLMTFCSDSILAKVDRASMAHSLEVRVPFLDHRLIEWAFPRPINAREGLESKVTLRDYVQPHVPPAVLSHPKQGFSLRVLDTFDWEAAVDRIQNGTWVRNNYWSRNWKGFIGKGVPYRNARIWNLLMLTLWADAWFNKR